MNKTQKIVRFWTILSAPFILFLYCVLVGHAAMYLSENAFWIPYAYHSDVHLNVIWAPLGLFFGLCGGILLHELGHAITARLLGGQVYRVRIGNGRILGDFNFGGLPWRLQYFPFSGMVYYGLFSEHRLRLKTFSITLAGPVISVIFAVMGFAALQTLRPNNGTGELIAFCVGWCAGSLIILPGTLIPFTYRTEGRKVRSDMLRLWSVARMTNREVAAFVAISKARQTLPSGVLTLQDTVDHYHRNPKDHDAHALALASLRVARDKRALKLALEHFLSGQVSKADRIEAIDTVLTIALELNLIAKLPNAETLANELVDLAEHSPTSHGTRGSILIDLGRLDEGESVLRELLTSLDPTILTYTNVFLAIAERTRGNGEAARHYARKAHQLSPDNPALARVRELLAASGSHR